MRTFSKILAVPITVVVAAGFLFAAGCSSNPCKKAVDNTVEFTKKGGSDFEKKMIDKMVGENKDAFIALCEGMIKKDEKAKKQVECQAKATDYKSLKACDSAAKDAKKGDAKKGDVKKDDAKKAEHK